MKVEARVGFAKASVGHVLEAIANAQVREDVPIETNVAGELDVGAEVGRAEVITADVSRIGPTFDGKREGSAAEFEARPNGSDEGLVVALAKPAGGNIHARLEAPVSAEVPAPEVIV